MKKVAIALVACVLWVTGGYAQPVDDEFTMDEQEATVITSTRLTYDEQKRYALFEENVVVTDPSLKLTADRLIVHFSEDDRVRHIEAVGNVYIEQENTKAWAGRAMYDVISGKIFMEKNPRIQRDRNILAGDTITFWRDTEKMVCEPSARLVLFPEEGGPREKLWGE